ncbi:PEP-CTERM sorting domain-containing protein [Massilia sp. CF038]|uniref:PEP-CTERM sorting domain-containing protein n=1 Tax=Massilia sp. CF038 TaxID=1881045 RepID=UPI0009195B4F|nr:PEP-CTERM sorting domain-containing protein [Massilia sp. CF038]SHG96620.1 PEP-CTERM protein-sorting domain-containing protein [Massilia sp. CF038]
MFKAKLALFLACITLSFNACAGWVQFTFQNAVLDNGSVLEGYFIQDLEDRSIAFYEFRFLGGGNPGMINMSPSGIFNNITSASNSLPGTGPTSFNAFDLLEESYYHEMGFYFSGAGVGGIYDLNGYRLQSPLISDPEIVPGYFTISGQVIRSAVPSDMLLYLQAAEDNGELIGGLTRIIPSGQIAVPEPTSLALLLLGAAALFGSTRQARRTR